MTKPVAFLYRSEAVDGVDRRLVFQTKTFLTAPSDWPESMRIQDGRYVITIAKVVTEIGCHCTAYLDLYSPLSSVLDDALSNLSRYFELRGTPNLHQEADKARNYADLLSCLASKLPC